MSQQLVVCCICSYGSPATMDFPSFLCRSVIFFVLAFCSLVAASPSHCSELFFLRVANLFSGRRLLALSFCSLEPKLSLRKLLAPFLSTYAAVVVRLCSLEPILFHRQVLSRLSVCVLLSFWAHQRKMRIGGPPFFACALSANWRHRA